MTHRYIGDESANLYTLPDYHFGVCREMLIDYVVNTDKAVRVFTGEKEGKPGDWYVNFVLLDGGQAMPDGKFDDS